MVGSHWVGWGTEICRGKVFGVGLPYATLKIPFQSGALFSILFRYTLYTKQKHFFT